MSDEPSDLRDILAAVAAGKLGVDQALAQLPLLQISKLADFACLDVGRALRKGVPEVVMAERKSDTTFVAIMQRFLADRGLALATRVSPQKAALIAEAFAEEEARGAVVRHHDPDAAILELHAAGYRIPKEHGAVGLLTAGTSDIPVAEEAACVLRHMGVSVHKAYDVGVAGVHRLIEPLEQMLKAPVGAFIVVAGMEGALPSVVAGLVDVPVIGVPTSTGYGMGGDGTAALLSILQSCSPGLVAVNIDNGVGAGAASGLIVRGRVEVEPGDTA